MEMGDNVSVCVLVSSCLVLLNVNHWTEFSERVLYEESNFMYI